MINFLKTLSEIWYYLLQSCQESHFLIYFCLSYRWKTNYLNAFRTFFFVSFMVMSCLFNVGVLFVFRFKLTRKMFYLCVLVLNKQKKTQPLIFHTNKQTFFPDVCTKIVLLIVEHTWDDLVNNSFHFHSLIN